MVCTDHGQGSVGTWSMWIPVAQPKVGKTLRWPHVRIAAVRDMSSNGDISALACRRPGRSRLQRCIYAKVGSNDNNINDNSIFMIYYIYIERENIILYHVCVCHIWYIYNVYCIISNSNSVHSLEYTIHPTMKRICIGAGNWQTRCWPKSRKFEASRRAPDTKATCSCGACVPGMASTELDFNRRNSGQAASSSHTLLHVGTASEKQTDLT